MPHFVNTAQRYFLTTNYKVLYTLLYYQPNLQVAQQKAMARNCLLKQWTPFPWMRHFLLVRDPYRRLESFYKDKFRQDPAVALRAYDALQYCQRFFAPYLQIDPADSPTLICEKLWSLSFAQFIQLLPQVYLLDGHLHPQVRIRTIKVHARSIQLNFDRILKVEAQADLAYLQDELAIDLSQKYNSTHTIEAPVRWQPDLRAVVNHLYQDDFVAFRYEMHLDS